MKSIWQKFVLCVLLCAGASIANLALMNNRVIADGLLQQELPPSSDSDRSQENTLLAANQERLSCQTLGTQYRDFYNFQTRNYYISICSKGEAWYYYRESKSNPDDTTLLPAKVVFGGDVFKAVHKKVTYFVGINSDGYYSSVMYGNDRMIFEPELLDVPVVATNEASVTSVEVSNSNTGLQNLDLDTGFWQVCTEDREDLHPYLNGWQKFIGQSPSIINKYASAEGHNLYYSDSESKEIAIETADGLIVTLDVIRLTETVGSVCVKPIASF